ncbi:hypothetical protein PBI_UNTOUCHABLE_18 [Gordonia phage Untouchable]|uniref:Uncharacterized protein n=2 Tax=Kenoshavirus TaxID=2842796 RepID=A0A649VBC1_9CAUD|nr:hypothetical protein HWC79_gp18 [Gordonia phage Untouchable]YP_009853881.1 hypothetical protein HWC81_gp18 [Gordonia phage Crocheter]QGJ89063.1 hypothetical protein PBI_UNTOUCHABLE_18 [Gordonia phage Untouchable]QGJ90364.1 hypothetical protein PBI_CROCHETER_18 [Gordonia phage Crocheter]WAB10404.1 hypothetical protein SEA_PHEPPER_19 [Gordonia phage Phepper]
MTESVEEFLAHYGVKGMKWGRRTGGSDGGTSIPRKTNREASKDAEEFARAKMFYGTGAGNRRKLIKASVEAKSKDPLYKQAFEEHLAKQDMGKHAAKAQKERRRKDVTSSTTKTAKGVHRQMTGGFGSVSLASAVIATAAVGAHKSGVDKMIFDAAMTKVSANKSSSGSAEDWLRKNGFA